MKLFSLTGLGDDDCLLILCAQVVMRELLEAGCLHGDCLTVNGKTVAENVRDAPQLADLKQVCRSVLDVLCIRLPLLLLPS